MRPDFGDILIMNRGNHLPGVSDCSLIIDAIREVGLA